MARTAGHIMSSFCQELIKLILQMLGALFVAWVTVRLALRRFKSERRWERQTSTLADLLVTIEEMDRINDIWLDAVIRDKTLSEERESELRGIWTKAARELEKSTAVAAVLLPSDIFAVVKQLRADLKAPSNDYSESLNADGVALQKARKLLIDAGRKLQTQ